MHDLLLVLEFGALIFFFFVLVYIVIIGFEIVAKLIDWLDDL